jgi:hypothetical protein
MKKYIITGIAAAIAATSAMAGTAISSKQVVAYEEPCLFRDNELQLDLFGLNDYYNTGRPAYGGGLGLNYFFSRFVGIGLEQSVYGRNSSGVDRYGNNGYTRWNTGGNLFLRYPICSWNLAPYVMVGGGANYGNVGNRTGGQGYGSAGGGLEYRFTETIGIFSDARYLFSGVSGANAFSQLMWRYGLRFAF